MDFSSVLRELRIRNGLTQNDLAKTLHITQQAYAYYEAGSREPSIDALITIADFYRVSLDALTGRFVVSDFRNDAHKANYEHLLAKMNGTDEYHRSVAYLFAVDEDCFLSLCLNNRNILC